MSNFYRKTKHPETGIIENAHWRDNYFGHHQYGVEFSDGKVFDPTKIKMEIDENPVSELPDFMKGCSLDLPELSRWKCYLFGSFSGSSYILWEPEKGKQPNWFWRWMQYLCFGNKWVKRK